MMYYTQNANTSDSVVRGIDSVIAQGKTDFQSYLFFRSEVNGVCVVLDGDVQSTAADEALYHEALVHPALLLHPNPKRVLIMGGGEGATSREVLRHASVEKVVMVDIDREFVELCKRHIPSWSAGCYDDPRHTVLFEDIREYIDRTDERFDVVIGDLVDAADDNPVVAEFYSPDFYLKLRRAMDRDGIIATQGGALAPGVIERHNRIRKGLDGVFRGVHSYGAAVPTFYALWGFVVAGPLFANKSASDLEALILQRGKERSLDSPATGLAALAKGFQLPRMIENILL